MLISAVIDLARVTGAYLLVSHFVYQYGAGIMTEALKLVDEARAQGIRISASGLYKDFAAGIGSAVFDETHNGALTWRAGPCALKAA